MNVTRCSYQNANYLDHHIPEEICNACESGVVFEYLQINDYLVPLPFLDFLAEELSDFVFEYNAVFSAQEMCGDELWASLDEAERAVAAQCLLILIKEGRIAVDYLED